jgi:hypothetical protein
MRGIFTETAAGASASAVACRACGRRPREAREGGAPPARAALAGLCTVCFGFGEPSCCLAPERGTVKGRCRTKSQGCSVSAQMLGTHLQQAAACHALPASARSRLTHTRLAALPLPTHSTPSTAREEQQAARPAWERGGAVSLGAPSRHGVHGSARISRRPGTPCGPAAGGWHRCALRSRHNAPQGNTPLALRLRTSCQSTAAAGWP